MLAWRWVPLPAAAFTLHDAAFDFESQINQLHS